MRPAGLKAKSMATYHCTVKFGAKGCAGPHAQYVSREGAYEHSRTAEKLVAVESGNMPKWAEHAPTDFWKAADEYERANGTTYREFELALPRELTHTQQLELIKEFIQVEVGKRPYTFGLHEPKAKLSGGDQPHVHIMTSDREPDGIERDPDQYFKRYNAKNPEKGGCRKISKAQSITERKEELVALRGRWAELQNKHLEKHGHSVRVDHRSLRDQGVDREPERHLGPVRIQRMTEADVAAILEQRKIEGERQRALDKMLDEALQAELQAISDRKEMRSIIIDLSGDLAAAKAERTRQVMQLQQEAKMGKPEDHYSRMASLERFKTLRETQEATPQVLAPKPQLDRSPLPSQQERYVSQRTKSSPAETPTRAVEPLSLGNVERYTLALKNVTSETLATVPGLLPEQAMRKALVEVKKEVEAEAYGRQIVDLEEIKSQVLAQPEHRLRLAQAEYMEKQADETFKHIAGMGRFKRAWFDTKGMTEEANNLLEAAKLERAQVRNSVNLSPEVQAAEKAIGESEQGRRRVAATLDELKDVESRMVRGEAAYKRPEHIYRVPDGVTRVIEKARQIAPGALAGMQATEMEEMAARAVDVAWKKPESQREFDVRVSRFVLPAEQRKRLHERDQAKQRQRGQGMER